MKSRIKNILVALKMYITIYWSFVYDFRQYIKYSISINYNSLDKSKARIMITMHAIEKGLSFKDKRLGWGRENAKNLTRFLRDHIISYGKCEVVRVALNVLNNYLNDQFATDDKTIREEIQKILIENSSDLHPNIGGVKPVALPIFNVSYEKLLDFYSTRFSVRNYSDKNIIEEEILKAKKIAQSTPTACNRQAVRLHIFKDKNKIKLILKNQLGDQGWADNANTLFIITTNQSYFGGIYERQQALIDGGLFAMNFVMGLHAQKIASCFKMYVRHPKIDRELKEIANIPQAEIPIVLILAGHYSTEESFSPASKRLTLK